MKDKQTPTPDVIRRIDEAIRYRIRETGEFDNLGTPVAAMTESDKYSLAKKTGAELADVEQRLSTICEEVLGEDSTVVPRYRLRNQAVDSNLPL